MINFNSVKDMFKNNKKLTSIELKFDISEHAVGNLD